MTEHAEDMIVRNLIEALNRLHDDLDRVELWTARSAIFRSPVPEYQPETITFCRIRKAPACRLLGAHARFPDGRRSAPIGPEIGAHFLSP